MVQTTLAPIRFMPVIVMGTVLPCAPVDWEVLVTAVVWLTPLSRVIRVRLPTES